VDYNYLFSIDNLFFSWRRLRSGKTDKKDIMHFELHLEDNLFALHDELASDSWHHSSYEFFSVFDGKKRDIHKAAVKDRLIHQVIYDFLLRLWQPQFISHTYASLPDRGSHRAVRAVRYFFKLAGSSAYVLKGDVKKYFASINHDTLLEIIKPRVSDPRVFGMIEIIVRSFETENEPGIGLPLGNVTSQIFANIYLNGLDHFVSGSLKARYYVRYNDDFIIIDRNPDRLAAWAERIETYVRGLALAIPPDKVSIRKSIHGVDFLGYKIFPEFSLVMWI